ncbi:hypothetical protein DFR67_104236 [Williamsia limnetica]|jgi:hypothetical protein|uniref:Uncharacterized protein n=1 Tax=Williamsia limnetica TaxID=882452 RepID=A0A318RMV7_WILLI|nr:hypothetical protein DFR67_104236 [Williamsia limnetica]
MAWWFQWHAGPVDAFWNFVGNYWWLVFVFGGTVGGAFKAVGAANERRAQRRQERYRLKQQAKIAEAEASGQRRIDVEAVRRAIAKSMDEHNQTDARWFAYETDAATLLDYPMMIDLRDPLTVDFHRAKRRADLLRPEKVDDLVEDPDRQREYRDLVHDYATAFDIAETEAKRRRRSGFSVDEQERLLRAQRLINLAQDPGASPEERRSAYAKARKELDGLIVLPVATTEQLEQRVAGQLER